MLSSKTKTEIETLAKGGAILGSILAVLVREATAGVTGKTLNERALTMLAEQGTTPSFLGYGGKGHPPFPAALCVSVNDEVVHGIPNDIPFKEGDVVKLDLGLIYEGLYLDSARTVLVGAASKEAQHLLASTRTALDLGIAAAQVGNTTGDIGHAIETFLSMEGLGVVRQLVGHGVGYAVHEEPQVPNYGKPGKGSELIEGLVIAIEPMVTIGDPAVVTARDGWTVKTDAGGLAAHEEDTVIITKEGPRIVTRV